MKKKLVDKKVKKLCDGKCYFCPCDDYKLLDLHRINYGQEYSDFNTITCCSLCHRKIHSGIIKIIGKHFSTSGNYVLHYFQDDIEHWK